MVRVQFTKRYCGSFPGAQVSLDDKEAARLVDMGVCKKIAEADKPEAEAEAGPLDELELDARVANSLEAAGLKDVASVEKFAAENENFLEVEGIGPAGDEQVRHALKKRGRR